MGEHFPLDVRQSLVDDGDALADLPETRAQGAQARLNLGFRQVPPDLRGQGLHVASERLQLRIEFGESPRDRTRRLCGGLRLALGGLAFALEALGIEP